MARTFRRIPASLLTNEFNEEFFLQCIRGHVNHDMPHKMFGPKIACDRWGPKEKSYFKRQHRRFKRRIAKNKLRQEIA